MTLSPRLYADHNATTPLRPQAREAMLEALARLGNPSSVHAEGRAARAALEAGRERLAALVGAREGDIVFTSGATEAAQLALEAAASERPARVLISAMEHDAIWAYGWKLFPHAEILPARADGLADLDWLEERLAGGPALVILQAANNETGALQAVGRASVMTRAAGGRLLVDAAQSFGKIDAGQFAGFGDWTILSAHKLGGPAGAGALVLAPGAPAPNARPGGGQERGRRPGVENLAAIAGFAAAAEAACAEVEDFQERMHREREAFTLAVQAARPDVVVFAEWALRLENTVCLALPGWRAETQVMALDLLGAAISAGAACSSGKVARSRTLAAILAVDPELDESLADCAIRVSFGWPTQAGEGARLAGTYLEAAARAAAGRARGGAIA